MDQHLPGWQLIRAEIFVSSIAQTKKHRFLFSYQKPFSSYGLTKPKDATTDISLFLEASSFIFLGLLVIFFYEAQFTERMELILGAILGAFGVFLFV